MDKLIFDMKKWNAIHHYTMMFMLILLSTCFSIAIYVIEKIIFDYDGIGLPVYVSVFNILVVLIAIFFIVKKRNKKQSLLSNGKIVKANFSKNELRFGYGQYFILYSIVGYLVEDNNTYMFNCEVMDFSLEGPKIFHEIEKRGQFPSIPVLVEKSNYNNYEVKVFDFLNETLRINQDIVDDIRYH